MKHLLISKEQARVFAAAFPFEEIKEYIANHREEYETFLSQITQNEKVDITPPKQRKSRKVVRNVIGGEN